MAVACCQVLSQNFPRENEKSHNIHQGKLVGPNHTNLLGFCGTAVMLNIYLLLSVVSI
jgi:hypothetical protein